MRDDIVSRREVMASLVAEYNRRYSEGGLKLAWIEKAVNDTPALQPSGGRLIDADKLKAHYSWWPENERTVLDQIVDAQQTELRWIRSEDRVPETDGYVLCCTRTKAGQKSVVRGYYADGRWCCGMNSNVTHWMPLPPLPDGGDRDA